jgi:hypothetical protein
LKILAILGITITLNLTLDSVTRVTLRRTSWKFRRSAPFVLEFGYLVDRKEGTAQELLKPRAMKLKSLKSEDIGSKATSTDDISVNEILVIR